MRFYGRRCQIARVRSNVTAISQHIEDRQEPEEQRSKAGDPPFEAVLQGQQFSSAFGQHAEYNGIRAARVSLVVGRVQAGALYRLDIRSDRSIY